MRISSLPELLKHHDFNTDNKANKVINKRITEYFKEKKDHHYWPLPENK